MSSPNILTGRFYYRYNAAMEMQERFHGALLGLATGDTLGTTLEFKPPGTFAPLTDMVGGGPFNLRPGQWTDDTSMALCLATSLVKTGRFDPRDQMDRYVRWYREGYLSSTGRCFDIGNTVRAALHRYQETGDPYAGSTHPLSAGNGSIMRLAPVPMCFVQEPQKAIDLAAASSRTTHAAVAAVDACRYLAALLVGVLRGASKMDLLGDHFTPVPGLWKKQPLVAEIAEIATGSFRVKQPPEIKGSGYVVRSLEAALWAYYHSDDFRSGALLAVNLGDDADTTGAVYGQIAGAYYGVEGIPAGWRKQVADNETIIALADALYVQAGSMPALN
jgi:ADP-ribosylglycohydrolase